MTDAKALHELLTNSSARTKERVLWRRCAHGRFALVFLAYRWRACRRVRRRGVIPRPRSLSTSRLRPAVTELTAKPTRGGSRHRLLAPGEQLRGERPLLDKVETPDDFLGGFGAGDSGVKTSTGETGVGFGGKTKVVVSQRVAGATEDDPKVLRHCCDGAGARFS